MSEELKPCPFCGAKPHRQLGKIWHDSLHGDAHQDTVIKCPHLWVTMQGSEDSVVERWNTRADLLPVVKPLVWVIDTADSQFAKWQWTAETYLIEERNHAPNVFDLICNSWDVEEAKRFESLEAAQAAAQADYEARIRALTPADAQAALDAAIAKAVNKKMEEVAAKAVEWSMKNPDEDMILSVFADEVLAMKEPE